MIPRRLAIAGMTVALIAAFQGARADGFAGTAAEAELDRATPDGREAPPAPSGVEATPKVRFRWPGLETDFSFTVGYVDLDPTTGIGDWACRQATYDGHQGNDINYGDFVSMDEGRFVVAAAPGTVTEVQDGYFDRQVAWTGAAANYVKVLSSDGTEAWYLHLRKWSSLVTPGETVVEGQPLGLVGSSGQSQSPHIHFQVVNAGTVYEPSTGSCNVGSSLWKVQKPDIFTLPTSPWQNGITTAVPTQDSLKERPPDVTHVFQNGSVPFYFWIKLKNRHDGDQSRVIYKRPDGTIHADFSTTHTGFCSNCSSWWFANLPSSGSNGLWSIEYRLNDVLQVTRTFTLDAIPYANPVANAFSQSVVNGIARGRMSGSDADSGIAWWKIVNQPPNGKVWVYGPRNRFYVYVPNAGFSGADTFQFAVEDAQGAQSAAVNGTFNVTPAPPNTLRCEGDTDGVSVPANASLNVSGALTIEAWIKRENGSAGFQTVFDRRSVSAGGAQGYSLLLTPDQKLRFQVGNGSAATVLVGATQLPLRRWKHVAATWNGTTLQVYVDGVLDGSLAFAGPISYTSVTSSRIGYSLLSTDESFRGEIDELRVWSVARTAAELQSGATCSFFEGALPSTVKARWPFNGNANDASSNANNGILIGNATLFRTNDSGVPLTCATDLDGDTVADVSDRCPLDADAAQTDSDADGVGDACDLCPSAGGRGQFDSDEDGIGDACDNCPFLGNTGQVDTDLDGSGDACEPAPSNAADGVPSDAITITASKPALGSSTADLAWTPGSQAASYEVYRGLLADVQSRFYGTCQNARDPNTLDTAFSETEVPAAGSGYYFLVIGVSTSGSRGRAGASTSGQERDLRARDCL